MEFVQTPWVIGNFLRGWQMDTNSPDPRAFLESVRPEIHGKPIEEIDALNGIKFQLALK